MLKKFGCSAVLLVSIATAGGCVASQEGSEDIGEVQVASCPSGLTASGSWSAVNIAGSPLISYTVTYDKITRSSFCDGVQVSSVCANISGGSAWVDAISLTSFTNGIGGFPTYNYTSSNTLPICESFGPNALIGQAGYWLTLQVRGWNGILTHKSSGWTQLN